MTFNGKGSLWRATLCRCLLLFIASHGMGNDGALPSKSLQSELAVSQVSERTVRVQLFPLDEQGRPRSASQSTVLVPFKSIEKLRTGEVTRDRELSVGNLRVQVKPNPLTVSIRRKDGTVVQELSFVSSNETNAVTFRIRGPLFGLGEGAQQFDRRGAFYPMEPSWGGWNRPVLGSVVPSPFLIGADGWALLAHQPEGQFDLRGETGRFVPKNRGALDLFVISVDQPADALAEYIRVTGGPVMPPKWALGYFQSHRTLAGPEEPLEIARTFREKKLPCDALIYLGTGYCSNGWNTGHGSVAFNTNAFGSNTISALHDLDFRVIFHVNRAPRRLFGESITENSDSSSHIRNYWARHRNVLELGADGWWPDDGDELPLEARLARHRCYYEGPLQDRPNARPWALHRTGYAGCQRYGGWIWSGDVDSKWETLAAHVSIGLNHGLSLTPFWGSDTGGFYPTRELTGELYVRWFQFSAFCPLFRSHGRTWKLRLPWGWNTGDFGPQEHNRNVDPAELHNAEVEPICRKYLELRYRLLPYNYSLAREAVDTGLPMMRALWLHYPKDAEAVKLGSQYLWGRDLLVAPVVEKAATSRRVYLPAGDWFDWWTGEKLAGARWTEQAVDLATLPIYARAGAIIPLDPVRQFTAQSVSEPTTLRIYPGTDGSFTLYDDDGQSLGYRDGSDTNMVWIRARWNDAAHELVLESDERMKRWAGGARPFRIEIVGSEAKSKVVEFKGQRVSTTFDVAQKSPQAEFRREQAQRRVFRDRITPHWFADNTRFWYRNDLRDGAKEFVLVDAERGQRAPAFDHAKLAAALSKAAGAEYKADRLPFSSIAIIDDEKAVAFKIGNTVWQCDLQSYQCSKTDKNIDFPADATTEDEGGFRRRRGQRRSDSPTDSDDSPDGKWTVSFKEHNVFIKPRDSSNEIQLSTDGKEGLAYSRVSWAPDSKTLIAWRVEPAERKEVYLVQSSPQGGGRAKMTSRPYALPGDKFTTYELNIFDMETRKQTQPDIDRFEHEWLRPRLRWRKDGRHFTYQQTDRGHQRFRLIEVDAQSGKTRNIIDEKSETFIWTAHTENLRMDYVNWLEQTDEIIYVSESNGWRHLYLLNPNPNLDRNPSAVSSTPITSGQWVIRGIETIDETNRQVSFRASGVFPDQDPYFVHFGRVNFDGTGLVWLTSANGNHTVQFSPDRKFVIDTYSRVDAPPINELRRVSDGKLVCKLEEADITMLKEDGWKPPEVFVAKGRDGKTDIWGIISRPRDFDPAKKYPIIEDIYAGPQGSFVPKSFSATSRYDSLTSLGFIVVKIDGMGTANRSKAFHDVCHRNLKDAGFEDRILWIKAAAKKYPHMDLTRVGVYGNSAGGQNAAAAVLFHPEFYKAAVASCGCHDNRMDKASWNEQWMGYMPPDKLWNKDSGNWYSQCSNIDNAHRLGGNLFLIVGEMDNNVPPESTMRFVDALIKADKDFELLVIPNGGHGMGGSYGQRRMQDFFVRHLLHKESPERAGE